MDRRPHHCRCRRLPRLEVRSSRLFLLFFHSFLAQVLGHAQAWPQLGYARNDRCRAAGGAPVSQLAKRVNQRPCSLLFITPSKPSVVPSSFQGDIAGPVFPSERPRPQCLPELLQRYLICIALRLYSDNEVVACVHGVDGALPLKQLRVLLGLNAIIISWREHLKTIKFKEVYSIEGERKWRKQRLQERIQRIRARRRGPKFTSTIGALCSRILSPCQYCSLSGWRGTHREPCA